MKKITFYIMAFLLCGNLSAQNAETNNGTIKIRKNLHTENNDNTRSQVLDYFFVEEKPEFPNGGDGVLQYISKNSSYPELAKENKIQGTVYVSFVIDINGNITNTAIVRGVHPSLDNEALRVIGSMPAWKPGKQYGNPVPVGYVVPINFSLR